MKKQQWEILASEGHVLLSRVNVYRRKLPMAYAVAGVGALLAFGAAYPAASLIGNSAGGVIGWASEKISRIGVTEVEKSIAPIVNNIRAVVPPGFSVSRDMAADLAMQVIPEMQSVLSKVNSGAKFDECDFGKSITENWATNEAVNPHCRYSKNGNRLWVWSIVLQNSSLQPWVGLFYRESDKDKFQFRQIESSGLSRAKNATSLSAAQIPRTIAEDFPELLNK